MLTRRRRSWRRPPESIGRWVSFLRSGRASSKSTATGSASLTRLLAAGAYNAADFVRRKEIHARLAELLDDPEARAWQLAASVDEAGRVGGRRARGCGRLCAHTWSPAARGPPPRPRPAADARPIDDPRRFGRAVEAAFLHFEAGDSRRAEAQLREVIAPLEPGPELARALVVLARIRLYEAPDEARELFEQVIDLAGADRQTLCSRPRRSRGLQPLEVRAVRRRSCGTPTSRCRSPPRWAIWRSRPMCS